MKRLALAAVLALAGTAHAQDVKKLESDAPVADLAAATDLVFVSEGYHADEEATFFADARRCARRVAQDPNAAPLRAVEKWNFHFVFVSSVERGAPASPGAPPRNTMARASVRADGFLLVDDAAVETAAVELAPDVDVVVALVRFAGSGQVRANADVRLGPRGRVRLPSKNDNALVHELGHALFGLGDEYVERQAPIPDERKPEIAIHSNLTCDPTGARWRHVTTDVVEGAAGWARCVFKCQATCVMNDHAGPTFCPVCLDAIARANGPPPAKPKHALAGGGTTRTSEDPIVIAWTKEATHPVRYWTTLSFLPPGSNTYQPVWWGGVEGHLSEKRLGGLPPGRYAFFLRAEGVSGSSEGSWIEFAIEKSPTGVVREPLTFMAPGVVTPSGQPVSRGIVAGIRAR